MNIVVYLKQTFDSEAKISLTGDGKINDAGVNLVMNPYDEFAVEEGIRLKEKHGGEVTVISVGPDSTQQALRTALAMGADKAVLVNDPAIDTSDDKTTATVLAKALADIPHDIVLAGRIAIDDGAGQLAIRLAEALDVPSVSSVVKLDVDGTAATAVREIDGGSETVEVQLPAVVTAQKGLNEPRYPAMAGIMKAKKKPLQVLTLADLGLDADSLASTVQVQGYTLPAAKGAGKVIQGEPADTAAELAKLLHGEAKVI